MPERYLYHEQKEQEFINLLGRDDIGILRKTVNGKTYALTLKQWREEIEKEPAQMNLFDEALGGCGCFVDRID
jgi:hypothetical protein